MKKQDMLKSGIVRGIASFALPLMAGNLLQQLYNTVDAVVVGRFVGKHALAAIGAAMPLYTVLSYFIIGATVGVGVYLAKLYGAGDRKGFKEETSTALITGLALTAVITVVLIPTSKFLLKAMQTPEEILEESNLYLLPLLSGLVFAFVYNFYTSGLRAVGNSFMPFVVLVFSAVLNVALDFAFVAGLRMGALGAGVATLLSQAAAGVLIVILAYRAEPLLALRPKELLIFRKKYLKKTLNYGSVTALQQSFISLGRLFVQSAINPLGTDAIAGCNAATRVEGFVSAPFDAMSVSVSTFAAQNIGARQGARVWKGLLLSLVLNFVYALFALVFLLTLSEKVMGIFVDASEQAVIGAGTVYLKNMALYYLVAAFTYILQGVHRGAGNLKVVFFATASQITLRVVLTYALVPQYGIAGVAFAIFAGWVLMTVIDFLCFHKLKKVVRENSEPLLQPSERIGEESRRENRNDRNRNDRNGDSQENPQTAAERDAKRKL